MSLEHQDEPYLFPQMGLPPALVEELRRMNPWWEGLPGPVLPKTRRHLVDQIRRRLVHRLAPIVVVRGPRQIGKTTAQLQYLYDELRGGLAADHVLRVQFDELPELISPASPILRIVGWFEKTVLRKTLNEAAHQGERTLLLFDEVQNLSDWAPQLKSLVDISTTSVVVTGSSALRIERGRDSLAGRITTIECGVLSITEVAAFRGLDLGPPALPDNGLEPLLDPDFWRETAARGRDSAAIRDEAFRAISARGAYPLVHQKAEIPWPQLADQLNETVIRKVIQHDLRVGDRGRKRDPELLEELFRLACRWIGQAPQVNKLAEELNVVLGAGVGQDRVRNYLRFLGDTLLLRLIEPLEIRLKKRRGSPKLCLADHALRASWLQEVVPLDPLLLDQEPHLSDLAGRIAESVVGATLSTIPGLDVSHLPERADQPEVDFILTIGTRRIPIEVKYQRRITHEDTHGLRAFLEKTAFNAPFGVLVSREDGAPPPDPRLVRIPLSSLMLLR